MKKVAGLTLMVIAVLLLTALLAQIGGATPVAAGASANCPANSCAYPDPYPYPLPPSINLPLVMKNWLAPVSTPPAYP